MADMGEPVQAIAYQQQKDDKNKRKYVVKNNAVSKVNIPEIVGLRNFGDTQQKRGSPGNKGEIQGAQGEKAYGHKKEIIPDQLDARRVVKRNQQHKHTEQDQQVVAGTGEDIDDIFSIIKLSGT